MFKGKPQGKPSSFRIRISMLTITRCPNAFRKRSPRALSLRSMLEDPLLFALPTPTASKNTQTHGKRLFCVLNQTRENNKITKERKQQHDQTWKEGRFQVPSVYCRSKNHLEVSLQIPPSRCFAASSGTVFFGMYAEASDL